MQIGDIAIVSVLVPKHCNEDFKIRWKVRAT